MPAGGRREVRHLAADLATVILVCRKCSKKLKGGFGEDGDEKLAKVLRRALAAGRSRKALKARQAVIEVDCLDLCPKQAVVALRADRPDDWVLVPKGTALPEILGHLGLPARTGGGS